MRRMQWNVEFGDQRSICLRTEENRRTPCDVNRSQDLRGAY